ncbi:MAG: tyrosine-type recombinase/integrase [Gemmataceae bacterium]|nr:tyrosine-type recombinase/integrase [Gemmataceae bacterium]
MGLTFRSVPMAVPLKAVMQEWIASCPGGQHTVGACTGKPVNVQMVAKGFRTAVDDSKWKVLLGWHLLRHSFASNCAAKSVDQRLIDTWMGHQTEVADQRGRQAFVRHHPVFDNVADNDQHRPSPWRPCRRGRPDIVNGRQEDDHD